MNDKECNHEFVFGGPYLAKAIENAYKDMNPEEVSRRLELALLKIKVDTMEGEKKTVIKTNLREALRMASELYTPKHPCINRLEEEK